MADEFEKKPYLVDDDFLWRFYSAAVDFGTDMVREGYTGNVDEAHLFITWLFEKAGVKAPDLEKYWAAVNKNYSTSSSSLKRTYGTDAP